MEGSRQGAGEGWKHGQAIMQGWPEQRCKKTWSNLEDEGHMEEVQHPGSRPLSEIILNLPAVPAAI